MAYPWTEWWTRCPRGGCTITGCPTCDRVDPYPMPPIKPPCRACGQRINGRPFKVILRDFTYLHIDCFLEVT